MLRIIYQEKAGVEVIDAMETLRTDDRLGPNIVGELGCILLALHPSGGRDFKLSFRQDDNDDACKCAWIRAAIPASCSTLSGPWAHLLQLHISTSYSTHCFHCHYLEC